MGETYRYMEDSLLFKGLTRTKQTLLQDRIKVEWTYTSNALEGNTISLGDTAFILEEGLTISGKTLKEHEEIVGHARAIDLVYALLSKDSLKKSDICDLHKAVQTMIIDIECPLGEYKVVENGTYSRIDGKLKYIAYPHPNDIDYLMKLWFDEFGDISNKTLSLEEAIMSYTRYHLAFTAIHPFFDGNGRVGRLVANIPMLKNKYLPIIIDVKKRKEYLEILSNYKQNTKKLDDKAEKLIEENIYLDKLFEFFKSQYNNSQKLLDEIKN
ncbi:MAG: Fic family protein [Campylobacterota bacterium]|nr:Fic family protein [Campylobacterota bacterium]